MRESGFGPLVPSGSVELIERIAQTLGVPVEVFYGPHESLGRRADDGDIEIMRVELVAAFRAIENPAIRSGVLMLVKRLVGPQGFAERPVLLKD